MRKQLVCSISGLLVLICLLTGCQSSSLNMNGGGPKIYFFDQTRNELVTEPLGDDFKNLKTPQEQVQYIIDRLVTNKSTQLTTLQNSKPIPYLGTKMSEDLEDNPIIKFQFTTEYNNLTPTEKIGIRASIVYSLVELEFIEGVDFYIEDTPLMTATGQTVGVIYPYQIKREVLDPNPATTPYTLSLYFLNEEGLLEKEMHGVVVSDSTAVEKLILEELIKGPSTEGLQATLPSDVKINEVSISPGTATCYVDLSFDTKSKFFTSDKKKEMMIYSIVNSLTELQQIKKVVIYLDGQSGMFTPDIDFSDILERSEAYISQ